MSKLIVNYKLLEPVGSGQYGKVFKAENIDDKKYYAVKVIQRDMIESNPKMKECIINEINTLSKIVNEYVIKFIEMHKTSNNAYLIYEFCDGGTLEKAMFENGYFRENEALRYFKQLVEGFQAIAEHNIIHRDLKPQNILLQNNNVKIADFGFCKPLKDANELTKTVLGSPIYMAPEIMKGIAYGIKSDIWSLGIVFYEILLGICPYEGNSLENMISLVSQGLPDFPSRFGISESTKTLIVRMLDPNPQTRIEWNDLFSKYGVSKAKTNNLEVNYNFDFTKPRMQTMIQGERNNSPSLSPDKLVNVSPSKFATKSPIRGNGFSDLGSKPLWKNDNEITLGSNFGKSSGLSTFNRSTLCQGLLLCLPLPDQSKNSVLLNLMHFRNKVLFGMELSLNLLNENLNKNLLLAHNVVGLLANEIQNFCRELQKPFGGVLLSNLSSPRSDIIDSFEFTNLVNSLKKESDLVIDLHQEINKALGFSESLNTIDAYSISRSLFSFAGDLIESSKLELNNPRNSKLLANQVFDMLLIHDIFERVLDPKTSFEKQSYFNSLKSINAGDLSFILYNKQSYLSKIIKV